jgi:hypothetical protein
MRFARSISSAGVSSRWRPISFRNSWRVSVVTVASAASSTGASALPGAVVAQLDAPGVQLLVDGAEVVVLEVEGLGQLVHLREVDAALLLAPVDQRRDGARVRLLLGAHGPAHLLTVAPIV